MRLGVRRAHTLHLVAGMTGGVISRPSDVTGGEAAGAVATAREAGGAAALLHDQAALARLADPPAEALPAAEAVFRGWFEAEPAQDAEGAAAFVADVVARLAPAGAPQETGQAGLWSALPAPDRRAVAAGQVAGGVVAVHQFQCPRLEARPTASPAIMAMRMTVISMVSSRRDRPPRRPPPGPPVMAGGNLTKIVDMLNDLPPPLAGLRMPRCGNSAPDIGVTCPRIPGKRDT